MKSLLHLGSGKVERNQFIDKDYNFITHVDQNYNNGFHHSIKEIEEDYTAWCVDATRSYQCYSSVRIFDFLDTYKFKFNKIIAHRIVEHMFYDDGSIGRFLDACNQITFDDATMEIIVPDFDKIIQKYHDLKSPQKPQNFSFFNSQVLLINSELQNTCMDPHGSTWSRMLAYFYIENEGGTWKIDKIEDVPMYKGRDIYIKIYLTKPMVK